MKFLTVICCTIFFLSCKNGEVKNVSFAEANLPVSNTEINFENGKVIDAIHLPTNANHSFAIYLPVDYNSKMKLPTMFFFDPHGAGAFAIEKYTQLAEQYNCILIGSNDSKNGLDFNTTFQIANELIEQTQKLLAIDEKKIMLCGFSGGAKVAIQTALQRNDISKVVYCGAALPIQNCNHSLQMLGFAGLQDMNYADVINFSASQLPNTVKNYCVEWYGKHEWPDAKVFTNAFYLLNNENNKINAIKISSEKIAAINQEENIHHQYYEALFNADVNYWTREILILNTTSKNDNDNGKSKRLLGYISLACYSISNQLIQQQQFEQAGKILIIYKMADPNNSDCDFMQAVMYARMENPTKVYAMLNMAYENGMKDFSKVLNEPAFAGYLNSSEMNQIKNLMSK